MGSISGDVDQQLLASMMSWAEATPDFEVHHAADGLYIARSAMLDPRQERETLIAALNTSFTFWIDDRSDKHLQRSASPVDWNTLLAFTDGDLRMGEPSRDSPEVRFLTRVAALMAERAHTPADYVFWRTTMGTVLRAMQFEEGVSRGGTPPSYAEYAEAGAASIAMCGVVAGLYVTNGISRSARFGDPWLEKLERYLGMSQRLMNDLFSAEKERRESTSGCVCNSVLLLERYMSSEQARSFVQEQTRGYDSLVEQCIVALGEEDPVVRMIRPMLRCIHEWYGKAPLRYGTG